MFVKIMDNHPDLCKEMLEMILDTKISSIEMIQYEDTLQPTYESKGIRLDVYLQDEAKSRYNIEMQAAPCPEIAKRSRYYHSTMDVEQLLKGEHYSELKKSFVIFICKDLGMEGYDLPIYTFMYRSEEDPEKYLNDETFTIFVNASGKTDGLSEEMMQFMEFVKTGNTGPSGRNGNTLAQRLQRAVEEARKSKRWSNEYMRWEDELNDRYYKGRKEGIEEGRKDGIEEGTVKTLAALVKDSVISLDEGVLRSGLKEEEFIKYLTKTSDATATALVAKSDTGA